MNAGAASIVVDISITAGAAANICGGGICGMNCCGIGAGMNCCGIAPGIIWGIGGAIKLCG
jgi:hypothetical protein